MTIFLVNINLYCFWARGFSYEQSNVYKVLEANLFILAIFPVPKKATMMKKTCRLVKALFKDLSKK